MNSRKHIVKRLLKTLFEFYPVMMPVVIACILFNAVISSIPTVFMQNIIAIVEQSWQSGDWSSVSGRILHFVSILIVFYVLSLAAGRLLDPGTERWRQQMARNLLQIAARKNLGLARRNLYTAPKTIRGRVTAYFSALAVQQGSLRFTLPFDRQQLADFLGVDRSALSNTLSRMQREGLLELGRRTVELHTEPEEL